MSWDVQFKSVALRAFQNLPGDARRRVATRIDSLAMDPRPHGAQKLSGDEDHYRVRAGDYRVIYTIDDPARVVWILKIGHRGDVYRR